MWTLVVFRLLQIRCRVPWLGDDISDVLTDLMQLAQIWAHRLGSEF